jgi:voltage-gated potassium channel
MPYFFLLLRQRNHWQHYRSLLRQIDMQHSGRRAAIYLVCMLALHSLAMVWLEHMAPDDAIWLTLTTVMTVGYGDYAAATLAGRSATVLLIYVGSVFVLFNFAGDYLQYRAERKIAMLKGRWRWRMQGHIAILNSPTVNRSRFITRLVDELRGGHQWCDCPVLLLSQDYGDGLPEEFQERGIVYYHGDPTDPDDLLAADAEKAAILIVLAENVEKHRSDEITFDILTRLREFGSSGRIVAECVRNANRKRLRRAGADIVLRPIRFYPEIVVRAIECPGTEVILENLFTVAGDECIGVEIEIHDVRWASLVTRLLEGGFGTAIAYADQERSIHTNPSPQTRIDARAIYLVVKHADAERVSAGVRPVLEDLAKAR